MSKARQLVRGVALMFISNTLVLFSWPKLAPHAPASEAARSLE